MSAPGYAIADPAGGWWYHLPETNRFVTRSPHVGLNAADGPPLLAGTRRGWFWSAEKADRIVIVPPPYRATAGYKLKDGYPPTEANPAELPASNEVDETVLDVLYERVTTEVEPDPIVVDAPTLELAGAPWPPNTPGQVRWSATLPVELSQRPEYLHLFPGRLTGVRDALKTELSAIPGVTIYTHDGWSMRVTAMRPSGPAAKPKGRKKRPASAPSDRMTRTVPGSPPTHIDAANREEAVAKYHALLAEWRAKITEVKVCTCCDGTGWEA